MKALHIIAFILVIIIALNAGINGAFMMDPLTKIFGSMPAMWINAIGGIAALFEIFTHKQNCRTCTAGKTM